MWSAFEVGPTRCNFLSSKQLLIFKFAAVPYVQRSLDEKCIQHSSFYFYLSQAYRSVCSLWKVKPAQPRLEEPVCSHHQLTSCFVCSCAAYLTSLTPIYISYIIVMYECIMQSPAPLDFTIELVFARTDWQMQTHRRAQTRTHTHVEGNMMFPSRPINSYV